MMSRSSILFFVSFCAAAGCWLAGCASTARQDPAAAGRLHAIRTVAVLPPEVKIGLEGLDGVTERLPDKEKEVRKSLTETAEKQLRHAGLEIPPATVGSESESSDDQKLEQTLARQAFEAVCKDSAARPVGSPLHASLGPEVGSVAETEGADALLFVSMTGVDSSQGKLAKDSTAALVAVLATAGTVQARVEPGRSTICVGLVDGTTGDVLWINSGAASASWSAAPKLEELLADFSTASASDLQGGKFFLCCNMAFDGDSTTDANYSYSDSSDRRVIAAGTPVTVVEVDDDTITIRPDGATEDLEVSFGYGWDYTQPGVYFRGLLNEKNPMDLAGEWPETVRAAAIDGRIVREMTKAQVLVTRGYPPFHQTAGTDANDWLYYEEPGEGLFISFVDGKVATIRTGPAP